MKKKAVLIFFIFICISSWSSCYLISSPNFQTLDDNTSEIQNLPPESGGTQSFSLSLTGSSTDYSKYDYIYIDPLDEEISRYGNPKKVNLELIFTTESGSSYFSVKQSVIQTITSYINSLSDGEDVLTIYVYKLMKWTPGVEKVVSVKMKLEDGNWWSDYGLDLGPGEYPVIDDGEYGPGIFCIQGLKLGLEITKFPTFTKELAFSGEIALNSPELTPLDLSLPVEQLPENYFIENLTIQLTMCLLDYRGQTTIQTEKVLGEMYLGRYFDYLEYDEFGNLNIVNGYGMAPEAVGWNRIVNWQNEDKKSFSVDFEDNSVITQSPEIQLRIDYYFTTTIDEYNNHQLFSGAFQEKISLGRPVIDAFSTLHYVPNEHREQTFALETPKVGLPNDNQLDVDFKCKYYPNTIWNNTPHYFRIGAGFHLGEQTYVNNMTLRVKMIYQSINGSIREIFLYQTGYTVHLLKRDLYEEFSCYIGFGKLNLGHICKIKFKIEYQFLPYFNEDFNDPRFGSWIELAVIHPFDGILTNYIVRNQPYLSSQQIPDFEYYETLFDPSNFYYPGEVPEDKRLYYPEFTTEDGFFITYDYDFDKIFPYPTRNRFYYQWEDEALCYECGNGILSLEENETPYWNSTYCNFAERIGHSYASIKQIRVSQTFFTSVLCSIRIELEVFYPGLSGENVIKSQDQFTDNDFVYISYGNTLITKKINELTHESANIYYYEFSVSNIRDFFREYSSRINVECSLTLWNYEVPWVGRLFTYPNGTQIPVWPYPWNLTEWVKPEDGYCPDGYFEIEYASKSIPRSIVCSNVYTDNSRFVNIEQYMTGQSQLHGQFSLTYTPPYYPSDMEVATLWVLLISFLTPLVFVVIGKFTHTREEKKYRQTHQNLLKVSTFAPVTSIRNVDDSGLGKNISDKQALMYYLMRDSGPMSKWVLQKAYFLLQQSGILHNEFHYPFFKDGGTCFEFDNEFYELVEVGLFLIDKGKTIRKFGYFIYQAKIENEDFLVDRINRLMPATMVTEIRSFLSELSRKGDAPTFFGDEAIQKLSPLEIVKRLYENEFAKFQIDDAISEIIYEMESLWAASHKIFDYIVRDMVQALFNDQIARLLAIGGSVDYILQRESIDEVDIFNIFLLAKNIRDNVRTLGRLKDGFDGMVVEYGKPETLDARFYMLRVEAYGVMVSSELADFYLIRENLGMIRQNNFMARLWFFKQYGEMERLDKDYFDYLFEKDMDTIAETEFNEIQTRLQTLADTEFKQIFAPRINKLEELAGFKTVSPNIRTCPYCGETLSPRDSRCPECRKKIKPEGSEND